MLGAELLSLADAFDVFFAPPPGNTIEAWYGELAPGTLRDFASRHRRPAN